MKEVVQLIITRFSFSVKNAVKDSCDHQEMAYLLTVSSDYRNCDCLEEQYYCSHSERAETVLAFVGEQDLHVSSKHLKQRKCMNLT